MEHRASLYPNSVVSFCSARTKRIAFMLLIALVIALAASGKLDENKSGMLKRGDFPAFYAAAVIVDHGEGASLYDASLQQRIENKNWASLNGSYYAFAYPAFVATLLSPLAKLPPLTAKALYTSLMFGALVVYALLMTKMFPVFKNCFLELFAYSFTFAPVFAGTIAGQNVALLMLLHLSGCYLLSRGYSWGAGLCLGLLIFKPHYYALTLLLLLGARLWKVAFFMLPALFAGYFLGVGSAGYNWPVEWLYAVCDFAERDFAANASQMVSVVGFLTGVSQLFKGYPILAKGFRYFSLVAASGLFATSIWAVWPVKDRDERNYLVQKLLFLGATVVLLSPHTLFYDLGLCLAPFAALLATNEVRRPSLCLLLVWLFCGIFSVFKAYLPIQPTILFAILVWSKSIRGAKKVSLSV